LLDLMMAALE